MTPHMILLNVNVDLLYAWLTDCIELARQEQALNPLRPQAQRLVSARLEPQHVPYYLRSRADWFVGVYARLPVEAPPLGDPLLIVGGYRLAEERIAIRIYRADGFPLLLHEVAWSLEERFPVDPSHPSPVPDCWRPLRPPPTPAPPASAAAPHPGAADSTGVGASHPHAGLSGAPVLSCNSWLEAQMASLAHPDRYDHLFAEWLQRYTTLRGAPPADPRRSFRRAAERILQQIVQGRLRRSLRPPPPASDDRTA
jgi:hypothetical protein